MTATKRKRTTDGESVGGIADNTNLGTETPRAVQKTAENQDKSAAQDKNTGESQETSDHNVDGRTKSRASSRKKKTTSTAANPPRVSYDAWPESFKLLSQTHKALNLVYTFLCTRKHLATTFNKIKKAVEMQMGGRQLTIEDIAKVKVLIPRAIRFEYVDEAILEAMDSVDGDRDEYQLTDLSALSASGGMTGTGPHESTQFVDPGNHYDEDLKELLLFEFIDEDLRRQVQNRESKELERSTKKSRKDDMKMPAYSQQQMLKLIEKRNGKFVDAVSAYLAKCEDEGVDPTESLERNKDAYIPVPPVRSRSGTVMTPHPDQIPKERKSISEIIAEIKQLDWYTGQIVPNGHRVIDPQPAVYGDLDFRLSQSLVNALYNCKGITKFYSHQAEAINALYQGHNVIVSTSTSSGKSLIYQIPMLHELEKDINSRGLYIFPTKALAQDQRRSIKELLQVMEGLEDVVVETYDGDTPMGDRNGIRDHGRIIFTNPDMLHVTILPQESGWRTFLKNLKFVVVDELHTYNGIFGLHVALVMRRLRRICAAVGNRHVKFVSCSATISNPEQHMKTIFGIDDVKVIDFDGSPSGRKEFLCWNTPFKDPNDPTSGRGDSVTEAARLFCQLVLRGVRVIAFCKIRKYCEIVLQAVKKEFQALGRGDVASLVMGYRGGYSPQDRRRIEKDMFEGKLMGIVATNALELGVDIGSLDAVITVGFPYSISNLRQQSGRAGRRNRDSLSVLIGESFPADQYYMKNPDEIFSKPDCEAQVDLRNELVLEGHIQCAAFEMPIRPDEDQVYFGDQLPSIAATRLVPDGMGFYHCHERFRPQPARHVSIRDIEENSFAVIDTTHGRNVVLEEVEESRAIFTIYEGGIFMHQGQTYLVQELNTERRFARVSRVHVDWNTQQRDFTDIDPIETEAIRDIGYDASSDTTTKAYFGSVRIRAVVYGFFKIDSRGRILDAVQVDNPPIERHTKGVWMDVPKRALEILASRRLNAAAAIHAAEHAILSLLPTYIISTPGDMRTECKVAKKELGTNLLRSSRQTNQVNASRRNNNNNNKDGSSEPLLSPPHRQRPARLTFYDTKGGRSGSGSGLAGKAFEFIDSLLQRALSRIEACACVTPGGCLECVCDERCKEGNVVMSKAGARVVLRCLLGWDIDVDALPWGEDHLGPVAGESMEELVGGYETVVLAKEVPMKRDN